MQEDAVDAETLEILCVSLFLSHRLIIMRCAPPSQLQSAAS